MNSYCLVEMYSSRAEKEEVMSSLVYCFYIQGHGPSLVSSLMLNVSSLLLFSHFYFYFALSLTHSLTLSLISFLSFFLSFFLPFIHSFFLSFFLSFFHSYFRMPLSVKARKLCSSNNHLPVCLLHTSIELLVLNTCGILLVPSSLIL